jgi:predicted nucleotidyltransferase
MTDREPHAMSQATPAPTPTEVLEALASQIRAAIGSDLIGLYVYGSFLSGGFDPDASDLDLVAVLASEVGEAHVARLGPLLDDFVRRHPTWSNRLDVVYIGRAALARFRKGRGSFAAISPGESFHLRTDVGDWLQSWYLLRETSRPLVGVDAAELVPPISREEFVAALVDNLESLRARAREDPTPGFLAYIVLTCCRALMTVRMAAEPSKAEGATWTRERMPEWAWLIDAALECRHFGGRRGFDDEPTRAAAREFIDAVAGEIRRPTPPIPR